MKTTALICCFALAALSASGCSAAGIGTQRNAEIETGERLERSFVWYNGKNEQRIWLNPNLVAEFDVDRDATRSVVKQTYRNAVEVGEAKGSVRIWKLNDTVNAETAVREIKTKNDAAKVSAVFHDQGAASGRLRALPGNVIVYLNPEWNRQAIDAWLAKNGLHVVKQLGIGKNVYEIETAPGLATLDLANRLYESGDVVAAIPNWWQTVSKR